MSPGYAPADYTLIAAVVLGERYLADKNLETMVREQCRQWFGAVVDEWRLLRTYRIDHALPRQAPPTANPYLAPEPVSDRLVVCGEHGSLPGLQWALMSGAMAGRRIVESRCGG